MFRILSLQLFYNMQYIFVAKVKCDIYYLFISIFKFIRIIFFLYENFDNIYQKILKHSIRNWNWVIKNKFLSITLISQEKTPPILQYKRTVGIIHGGILINLFTYTQCIGLCFLNQNKFIYSWIIVKIFSSNSQLITYS